jgi:hypothetical protein
MLSAVAALLDARKPDPEAAAERGEGLGLYVQGVALAEQSRPAPATWSTSLVGSCTRSGTPATSPLGSSRIISPAGFERFFAEQIQRPTIVAASAIRWSFVQGGPIVARGPCRTSSARSASMLTA